MRRVAISAGSQAGADAGAAVADAGGNAVDAAVAATMTGMITDPGIIGPGAGCFVTIWSEDREAVVIDGYAAMPGLGVGLPEAFGERVWMEYGGGMHTLVGPASVAVPGVWAGLGRASEGYGALPWASLVEPAIRKAHNGFRLSPVSEAYLAYAHDAIYDRRTDSFKALHRGDGSRVADGDLIRIEGLAPALEVIADEGPESFYTGSIGERLLEAMGEWGGSITAEDLSSYRPIERPALEVELDGWTIATNPPPAVGGATLAAMLLLLESEGFSSWDAADASTMAAVQRAVLRYRGERLDGATDPGGAAAALLEMARFGDLAAFGGSPSTIHVSAVDSRGLGCAITTSAGYGSGMMVPGTGLWLNNCLGEVELFPNGVGALGPGDRLPSNMAPTVAAGPNGEVMAIGSPGASRITTSLAQVIFNFIGLEMSVTEAVAHPRLHVEVFEGEPTVAHEPGIHLEAPADMRLRRFPDLSMYFGGVGLAMVDPIAGLFEAADPRRSGVTAVGGL